MADAESAVFVVDDDASVRDAIRSLLKSVGLNIATFESTEEFLELKRPAIPSCLVLDVKLPGVSGLEFQDVLAKAGIEVPIIFITAHGDIPMALRAMKGGAVEFLTKPFQKEDLLKAIHQALEQDRVRREEKTQISALQSRVDRLTAREREVMDLVVTGLMNKEIAAQLGLSEVTVKIHRGHVMQKMQATSLAELVRIAEMLKRKPRK